MNGKASSNRGSRKDADMERSARDEQVQTKRPRQFDTQVDIRFDHYRVILADTDGVSGKAAIDGIVHCGLLRDDSTKEVREVRHFQHKVKNWEDEKTVITLTEVD
jgi:hypothetical protein